MKQSADVKHTGNKRGHLSRMFTVLCDAVNEEKGNDWRVQRRVQVSTRGSRQRCVLYMCVCCHMAACVSSVHPENMSSPASTITAKC